MRRRADTFTMARKPRYNNDPDIVDVPLSVDEAQWVADNAHTIANKRDAEHFARRSSATSRQVARIREEFDQELRRRTAAGTINRGAPPTMSPEQAARFLSPEQLAKLFDRLSQDKLAALNDMREQAQAARDDTQRLRDTLRAVAHDILAGTELNPESLEQLRRALNEEAPTP